MPLNPLVSLAIIRCNLHDSPSFLVKRKPLPENRVNLPEPKANISERHLSQPQLGKFWLCNLKKRPTRFLWQMMPVRRAGAASVVLRHYLAASLFVTLNPHFWVVRSSPMFSHFHRPLHYGSRTHCTLLPPQTWLNHYGLSQPYRIEFDCLTRSLSNIKLP